MEITKTLFLRKTTITTVVANKETIACDTQATHSGGYKFKLSTKIQEVYQPKMWPTPFFIGFSGQVDSIPDIMDFFINIGDYKKPPKCNAECLVLTHDKKLFTFMNPAKWLEVKEPFYAVGSGRMVAIGAMESGKTPLEAVKIAAKHDPHTGAPFKSYSFK